MQLVSVSATQRTPSINRAPSGFAQVLVELAGTNVLDETDRTLRNVACHLEFALQRRRRNGRGHALENQGFRVRKFLRNFPAHGNSPDSRWRNLVDVRLDTSLPKVLHAHGCDLEQVLPYGCDVVRLPKATGVPAVNDHGQVLSNRGNSCIPFFFHLLSPVTFASRFSACRR